MEGNFLIIIAIALYYQTYSAPWPPKTPLCPDYWVAVPGTVNSVGKLTNFDDIQFNPEDISDAAFDASGAVCVNVKNLGTCPAQGGKYLVKDFSGDSYQGSSGACQKLQWAKKCGVSWDGITYGTKYSPCDANYKPNDGTSADGSKSGQCYLSSLTFSSLGNSVVKAGNALAGR